MFLSLAILTATANACEEPLKVSDINEYLEQSTAALKNMDATQASLLIKSIGNTINCLNEPVTPEFASEYFLMQGILLWANDEQDDSLRYFDAAKSISPEIKISTDIFPQTHEIHIFFKVAPQSNDRVELQSGEGETFYFDGVEGLTRPENRPTIFQRSRDGAVMATDIIDKGEDIPSVQPVVDQPTEPLTPVVIQQPQKSNALLWVAIGTGTASAGFGGYATKIWLDVRGLGEDEDVPVQWQTRNNISVISATTTGIIAGVTGIVWLNQKNKTAPQPTEQ